MPTRENEKSREKPDVREEEKAKEATSRLPGHFGGSLFAGILLPALLEQNLQKGTAEMSGLVQGNVKQVLAKPDVNIPPLSFELPSVLASSRLSSGTSSA